AVVVDVDLAVQVRIPAVGVHHKCVAAGDGLSVPDGGGGGGDAFGLCCGGDAEGGQASACAAGDDAVAVPASAVAAGLDEARDAVVDPASGRTDGRGRDETVVLQIQFAGDRQ